jgi:hypothetical protein
MWWDNKRHTIQKIGSFLSNTRFLQTRFYYDILDLDHFIILHESKSLLGAQDKKRGYVERSWFLDNYRKLIQGVRLTKRSCLVEYNVGLGDFAARVYVR